MFYFWLLLCILSPPFISSILKEKECNSNLECETRWPQSFCRRGRCACKPNYIRRKSDSRGWVCLSLLDAATSMLGPPLTCPLPDGAGFRVIYRDANGTAVFCQTKSHEEIEIPSCPDGYECIQAIGIFSNEWDGVCCPKEELSCTPNTDLEQDGWLERWYFKDGKCEKFMWNPKLARSPNVFTSESQCFSYCMKS